VVSTSAPPCRSPLRSETPPSWPHLRQYIGQYSDTGTGLDYLNARFYNPVQGQFLSEDPIALGDPKQQRLSDPQSLNIYSYANDNPIVRKDPSGLTSLLDVWSGRATWSDYQIDVGQGAMVLSQESPAWNYSFSHPYSTGALVGTMAALSADSALASWVAFRAALYPGVSAAYSAQQTFAGLYYGSLTLAGIGSIPGNINTLSQVNFNQKSTALPAALSLTVQIGPNLIGGYVGSVSDMWQFLTMLDEGLTNLLHNSNRSQTSNTNPSTSPINSSSKVQASGGGGGSTNGGYGSSGTSYTSFVPGDAHSACGLLCR